MVVVTLPLEDVHSLRVALQPCPCTGPKSSATKGIRERLSKGLAKAMFKKPTDPPTGFHVTHNQANQEM